MKPTRQTIIGKPCVKHPALLGLRYTPNRLCVECSKATSKAAYAAREMTYTQEIVALKAECEGLRAALTECSDSLHGEMLQKFGGQLPDDMHPVTRREYDRDMAEVAGYRASMGKGEQS